MGVSANDILELLFFWAGFYAVLRSLRGTRGLGILKGSVGFLLALYLFSKLLMPQLDVSLDRVTFVLESLITVTLIALVIIFQPEVRRGLTRLGERPLSLFSGRSAAASSSLQVLAPIVDAAGRLSRRRIGALMVMERATGIGSVTDSGVPLSADVSSPLIQSIFYPKTPLHDGALVIRGGTIVAGSCLLPLTENPNLGPEVGTRHRAAVGLTEECDGAVIVVSEQTGRISVAFLGTIHSMRDTRDLEATLHQILDGEIPEWAVQRESVLQRTDADETQSLETRAGDEDDVKTQVLQVDPPAASKKDDRARAKKKRPSEDSEPKTRSADRSPSGVLPGDGSSEGAS